ncbi:DUF420 domain-containing protein [Salisediminibacterium halotolerans]|uniref:Membrane protein n=1 Tax=Salisediminibacterium halotolerans TaxID=517425 RepID=A0A1H9WFK2_9BACI|nr:MULTISPECIES: DUF420 domain-containing protein [Salisediminibacterium]RLJ77871.1 putative membrane protein [Actinophytocola xinjiangensis]RPE88791.1 putative membrane protein [Salisediminibacterium halotolerans]TWG36848.1 putative membrane protein [Salisediminibacterium halotolerans]SES32561.1 putative membrane protein [Salisediminibacterium haloalkalitolerans]GEL07985.1 membrane protein [Salisediminibacterium halotolerans]
MNLWYRINHHYGKTIVIITFLIIALITVLSFLPGYQGELPFWITQLPLLNAVLNSFTFLFLLGALAAILQKNVVVHRRFIYAAFSTTALFLVSYVTFHFMAESTSYGGTGMWAAVYYFILITHIILAAVIVPLALTSFFTGINDFREKHKRWSRWTMPIWLYVSITGVLVYMLISPYYAF